MVLKPYFGETMTPKTSPGANIEVRRVCVCVLTRAHTQGLLTGRASLGIQPALQLLLGACRAGGHDQGGLQWGSGLGGMLVDASSEFPGGG